VASENTQHVVATNSVGLSCASSMPLATLHTVRDAEATPVEDSRSAFPCQLSSPAALRRVNRSTINKRGHPRNEQYGWSPYLALKSRTRCSRFTWELAGLHKLSWQSCYLSTQKLNQRWVQHPHWPIVKLANNNRIREAFACKSRWGLSVPEHHT
jgi:hypothetical protein